MGIKRKSKEEMITESNIRSGFYKSEFNVVDAEKEVQKYILKKPYGEIITHLTLSSMLGYNLEIEKQKEKYKRVMNGIRNNLIEHGYVLRPVIGIGYYILRPKEISKHCYKTYIKRTMNLLDKSDRVLVNVDCSELSEERLEELNNIKELNNKLNNSILKGIEESRYYDRMEYYNNLKDD